MSSNFNFLSQKSPVENLPSYQADIPQTEFLPSDGENPKGVEVGCFGWIRDEDAVGG